MTKESEIETLKKEIIEAREAYYHLDPKITDKEYDAKIERLKELKPNDEQILSVGAEIPKHTVWNKVKHEIQMGSLNKVNSESEFEEWAKKVNPDDGIFFVTHKIDGSSMELIYDTGKLVRCVTRGDGIIGEDVTVNISKVPSIPKELPVDLNVTIRGEIVMLKSVFKEKYAAKYANPRNTAAAKVREKKNNGEDCKNLEFVAYWMIKPDNNQATMTNTMTELTELGFKIPSSISTGNIYEMKKDFESNQDIRDSIEYEIDGMVISVDSIAHLEELGSKNMRPEGQIAWKFDAAASETSIVDVKWGVGPSGRICPVAVVEPVNIGGVTITNVSLHNLAMFNKLKLWKSCRVLILRKNDVIPYIEANISDGIWASDE